MSKSPALRAALVALGVLALLAFLRFQSRSPERAGREPQAGGSAEPQQPREELTVGFLPVT